MSDLFDQETELAAITRSVAATDDEVTVQLQRHYEASIEQVWAAISTASSLSAWFAPVSGDLRVGGGFSVAGNASADILTCDRPDRLRVTFGSPDSVVLIELSLPEGAAGTTLTFRHTVPLAMAGSAAGAL